LNFSNEILQSLKNDHDISKLEEEVDGMVSALYRAGKEQTMKPVVTHGGLIAQE